MLFAIFRRKKKKKMKSNENSRETKQRKEPRYFLLPCRNWFEPSRVATIETNRWQRHRYSEFRIKMHDAECAGRYGAPWHVQMWQRANLFAMSSCEIRDLQCVFETVCHRLVRERNENAGCFSKHLENRFGASENDCPPLTRHYGRRFCRARFCE